MKLLRIDLNTRSFDIEERVEEAFGGRLLTVEILTDEVDPNCDPLGIENKLVLAAGPLAGWNISGASRLSIGAKSPLTGGIRESNSGGMAGDAIAGLGLRGVIFSGKLPDEETGIVVIDDYNDVKIQTNNKYREQRLERLTEMLKDDFSDDYVIVAIGPAGEMQLPAAGVCITDVRGNPFRFAARGGLGAVMGSKNLKAVLLRKRSYKKPESEEFRKAVKVFHEAVKVNPRVATLRKYGTASTVMYTQSMGALPTRNFSQGEFEGAEKISGEAMYDRIVSRGGDGVPSESCMSTCIIQCSNSYPDKNGKRLVGKLEYETLIMCGSNLGIDDMDSIAGLNQECNELGLDTIEIGSTLGVAAEAGLMEFGDSEKAFELLEEVAKGSPLGRLLGQGSAAVGRILNVKRVPVAKNMALAAYDPRGVKGTGISFITSPMGGDHTAGLTIFVPRDHQSKDGQIELSRETQIRRASFDTLGLCSFLIGSVRTSLEMITNMINHAYGLDYKPEWLDKIGLSAIRKETDYNRKAGLTGAKNWLPKFFSTEPLMPHGQVFDFKKEELENFWD